jgi:hypothetical protein
MGQIQDFEAKNESVESVINRLKEKSDFQFVYNKEEVDECPNVTFSLSNTTVEAILAKSLENSALTYKKVANTLVITPKSKPRSNDKSNSLNQTIRGRIMDADSKLPLIGATILVAETSPPIGAISDVDGNFRIAKVRIGRVNLKLSYMGYESKIVPNVLVNSAKETVINLQLRESITTMEEVVVTAEMEKGVPVNDMVQISGRSISPEESNRYAGPFNDPTRIMSNFAGVAATQDGSNDIIVRGNSPKYIQWRLEGIQITNPNHFANQNGIGSGGISALNNNLLEKSDFYTGAFSAEYGDVLSGVYDVRLRAGNNEKMEGIFGLGLMGTDITLEGPLKKGYDGAFLVNYRYSTVSLIADLGLVDVTGAPRYQDAAFKVTLPTKKIGDFSIFGIWGVSGFDQKELIEEAIPGNNARTADLLQDHKTETDLLNIGLAHTYYLNDHSSIHSTLLLSTESIDDEVIANRYQIDDDNQLITDSLISSQLFYDSRIRNIAYRAATTYSNKINSRNKLQMGSKYAILGFDTNQSKLNDPTENLTSLARFDEKISTLSNFINWKYRPIGNVTVVAGIHNMNVLDNNKSTIEPRLSAVWGVGESSSIHAGFGMHSTMENIHNQFAKVEQPDGSLTEPNRDLGLLKAQHYVLGYQKRFGEDLMVKLETYYQRLYNLPVAKDDTSYYATINEGLDYQYVDLVNEGTGKNYGFEVSIEKYFSDNYYFLINGTVFQSKYKSLEGVERNTAYNGRYIVNILAGREFENLGKNKNQIFTLNAKIFFGGGRNIIPLLRDNDGNLAVDPASNRIWDYDRAYDTSLDNLFQIDLSMAYRWNKPKVAHELYFNIYDITDARGNISEYYDANAPGGIGYIKQFGLFPNLMYKVYF